MEMLDSLLVLKEPTGSPEIDKKKMQEKANAIKPQFQETADFFNRKRDTYSITEAANETGLTPQYVYNLIERYEIIQPKHDEIYHINHFELDVIRKVADLLRQGFRIRDIKAIINTNSLSESTFQRVNDALRQWLAHPDRKALSELVHVISEMDYLEEEEQYALRYIYEGHSLDEVTEKMQTNGDPETRRLIESACHKIGRILFTLFFTYAASEPDGETSSTTDASPHDERKTSTQSKRTYKHTG